VKNFIIGFLLASILVGAGTWFFAAGRRTVSPAQVDEKEKQTEQYYCPMHPTFTSDKPGDCPICGMGLVPLEKKGSPVKSSGSKDNHGAMKTAAPQTLPAGYVEVSIPQERLRLIGVTYADAKFVDLEQTVRTVGIVTADETRLHHIHSKFEGYIEDIYADYVGEYVKKGSALFSIYSPELVATQREYLLALKAKESSEYSSFAGVDLLEAARRRLSFWDIGAAQIEQLEKTREPMRAVTIRSHVSGYITAKTVVHGARIMPSDSLYDLMDLSRVWVMADVYEVNLPFVKAGMPATVTLSYDPGRSWKGRVSYLNPSLDSATRTIKARVEIENSELALKPGMYTNVTIGGKLFRALAVPESAVISTGERSVVFVSKGEGTFEPREITAGVKAHGFWEVKSGLTEGEKVATGANFLLDSESKLRAAIEGVTGGQKHAH